MLTLKDALERNPQAPLCSICDNKEPRCHPKAVAVVCSTCTHNAANSPRTQIPIGRPCPDCGKPVLKHRRYCNRCRTRRRKQGYRAARHS